MAKQNEALVLLASPRRNSNSTAAALAAAAVIAKKIKPVNVNDVPIKPCSACGSCAKIMKCRDRDGAAALIRLVERADTVIAASPVYFTGVPAPFKAFIDKNQPQWEKYRKRPAGKKKMKTGIIVLTAGCGKKKYFAPAESEIRSFFAVNGIKTRLVIRLGRMDRQGASYGVLTRVRKAAGKLVKNG